MTAVMALVPTRAARADAGTLPAPTAVSTPNPGGDMGPLQPVDSQIRQWGGYIFSLLADMVVVTVAIVGMIQCLKAAGSGFLGMHGQTGAAIVGLVGLVLVVLITFIALPALIDYLGSQKPPVPF